MTLHRPPRNQVDEEPLCECATSKSLFTYFLFIFYLKCDQNWQKLTINRQSYQAIETLFCDAEARLQTMTLFKTKKTFILQPCYRIDTLFYDSNSFYKIEIFFKITSWN